jgi:hypothetical protein
VEDRSNRRCDDLAEGVTEARHGKMLVLAVPPRLPIADRGATGSPPVPFGTKRLPRPKM